MTPHPPMASALTRAVTASPGPASAMSGPAASAPLHTPFADVLHAQVHTHGSPNPRPPAAAAPAATPGDTPHTGPSEESAPPAERHTDPASAQRPKAKPHASPSPQPHDKMASADAATTSPEESAVAHTETAAVNADLSTSGETTDAQASAGMPSPSDLNALLFTPPPLAPAAVPPQGMTMPTDAVLMEWLQRQGQPPTADSPPEGLTDPPDAHIPGTTPPQDPTPSWRTDFLPKNPPETAWVPAENTGTHPLASPMPTSTDTVAAKPDWAIQAASTALISPDMSSLPPVNPARFHDELAVPETPDPSAAWVGSLAQPPSHAALQTAPLPVMLNAHPGQAHFAQTFALQLGQLARDGIQEATLHLSPAELGQICVQITLDGRQTQVDFQATHAHTRELLHSSMDELSRALNEVGLQHNGSQIRDGSTDAQARQTPDNPRGRAQAQSDAPQGPSSTQGFQTPSQPHTAAQHPSVLGRLDLFA